MRPASGPLSARRLVTALVLCASLLGVCILLSLSYGSSPYGGIDVTWRTLTGSLDTHGYRIVVQSRLPRAIFAACVGAALACSGAVFQAVLRNPLADPYILGVSGGAALGGTLLLVLGSGSAAGAAGLTAVAEPLSVLSPTAAAFVGALGTLTVIYAVDRWTPPGRTSGEVLLLTGVIINAFASSALMFLKSVSSPEKAQEMLFYLMGTLAVEGTSETATAVVAATILASIIGIYWFARDLNVLSLGDEEAAALGVDVDRVRWWTVILSSVGVACAVAFTGLIGFVGLVVPHGVRLVVGPDHRILIPCCGLAGAAFLVVADVLTRVVFPVFSTALPVGVLTAFLGAPLFMFFLWRHLRHRGRAT